MNNILLASIIGLAGVIIGSFITSIYNLKLKSKETKLRVIEKIFDKRIQAHENVLFIIKEIRTVISTGQSDLENNLISFPKAMTSRESLSSFKNEIFRAIHENVHWLNTNLEREFDFLQDYLTSLENIIQDAKDSDFPHIGIIVKQDFIDIASSLENIAFEFFRKDIYEIKINKHDEWHKYPKEKTYARFNQTFLITKRDKIEKIISK